MPAYNYKARDNKGKLVEGVMSADTKDAIADKLKKMGHVPVTIDPVKGSINVPKVLIILKYTIFFLLSNQTTTDFSCYHFKKQIQWFWHDSC